MPRDCNVIESPGVQHRHREAAALSSIVSAADGRQVAVIADVLRLTTDSIMRCLCSCHQAAVIADAETLRADAWPRNVERGSASSFILRRDQHFGLGNAGQVPALLELNADSGAVRGAVPGDIGCDGALRRETRGPRAAHELVCFILIRHSCAADMPFDLPV